MKYFRMSYEEVVFRRSYLNILLLNRSIPSFNLSDKEDNPKAGKSYKRDRTKFRNESELFMSLM